MEDNTQKAIKLFKKMIEENKKGIPILVEGITDKETLKELGCNGEIFIIKGSGYTLYSLAEKVAAQSNKAIILTDPDRAGARIAGKLADILEREGVHPDLRYRKISNLLKFSQVAHIKIDSTLLE